MPREQGAGPNNTNDTSNTGDTGGTGERGDTNRLTDWQRIDAEKPQRDALSRKWDAENDPSPDFENAARPLPPDYGSHRPKHLELSEAQKEELEATYGRPIDQLLALRDNDPRAGHNRDEHGNILARDGTPRQLDVPAETPTNNETEHQNTPAEQTPSDTPDQPSPNLEELVDQLSSELRSGNLSRSEAADRLDHYLEQHEPAAPEPTSDLVREDDDYRYEKGTPAETPEALDPEDLSKLSELRRIAWRRGDDIHDALDKGVDHAFEVVESIQPSGSEQRQPADIPSYDQPRHGVDAGDAATAAMVVAVLAVEAVRIGARKRERDNPA